MAVFYFSRTAWVQKIKAASEQYIDTEKKKREKAYQGSWWCPGGLEAAARGSWGGGGHKLCSCSEGAKQGQPERPDLLRDQTAEPAWLLLPSGLPEPLPTTQMGGIQCQPWDLPSVAKKEGP